MKKSVSVCSNGNYEEMSMLEIEMLGKLLKKAGFGEVGIGGGTSDICLAFDDVRVKVDNREAREPAQPLRQFLVSVDDKEEIFRVQLLNNGSAVNGEARLADGVGEVCEIISTAELSHNLRKRRSK